MRLLMIGLNHRTGDVALREKLAMSGERLDHTLTTLRQTYPAAETVILSTCNRTEIYLARPTHHEPDADTLARFLASWCDVDAKTLASALIHREQEQAAAHLFRVCAGLDSMVLGEPQILGQVKRAYEQASAQQTVGVTLHRVFQDAIATAKRVRHETAVGEGNASIGSAAVQFARRIFDHFDDKIVLGIGAGEMAKLTLRHFQGLNPAKLIVTNRTASRAQELADHLGLGGLSGGASPFENLDELLVAADVVVTSTGSTQPILTASRFKPLLKRRRFRPLFIIDIAVPRDVEPEVGQLTNTYLYNIDDLDQVVSQAHQDRADRVRSADALIHESVQLSLAAVQHQDVGEVIRALRQRLEQIGESETKRTVRKLATSDPQGAEQLIVEHTHRLINKMLHMPLRRLAPRRGDASMGFYAAALRGLFDLDDTHECPSNHPTSDIDNCDNNSDLEHPTTNNTTLTPDP